MEPCGHSLHKDHYQYFAYANMVASFKLVLPSCILIILFFCVPSHYFKNLVIIIWFSVVLKRGIGGILVLESVICKIRWFKFFGY